MKNKEVIVRLAVILLTLSFAGCSKSATSSAISSTLDSLKAALASIVVTSPTATSSSSLAMEEFSPSSFTDETTTPPTNLKPIDQMKSDLDKVITAGDPAAVAASIGSMSVTTFRAPCYGPTWTDNATGASVNRPSGDLGLVNAIESPTSNPPNACAPAQLSALMGGSPQFANQLRNLQMAMIFGMGKDGKALPAVSEEANALTNMPAISGLTITAAKLKRFADDAEGLKVYKTTLTFTDTVTSKSGTIKIYHSPKNDGNTNFKGLIQAILPYNSFHRALSMVYEQTAGVLTYALDTAANRGADSQDFFKAANGRVDFSKAAFGEDGNRIIATFNTTTGAVTMHYAWQAGSGDGAVRAFAVTLAASARATTQAGVAYFGFGAAISTLTDDVSTAWPTKMFCNWLSGLANGTSQPKVQGQTFTKDTTTGVSTAVTSNISFAPTNSCSGDFTVSAATPTEYNGARFANPHNLVTIGSMGAIPAVTVPTYTLPE